MTDHGGSSATRARLMTLVLPLLVPGLVATAPADEPAKEKNRAKQKGTATPGADAKGTKAAPTYTYTKDVAPILQAKCQNCHRKHQVGPFALETYEQARKRAHDIVFVTEERSMPPWKPTRGVGPKLKHDQSLTPAELAVLAAWAESGARAARPRTSRRRPGSPRGGSSGRPT